MMTFRSVFDEIDHQAEVVDYSQKLIVCVDNSFVNLTSVSLMLEMTGYQGEVKCFQTSESAVDYIVSESENLLNNNRKIDMIITDASMPCVNGLQMVT